MKRLRTGTAAAADPTALTPLESLPDEILFSVLDLLRPNPLDAKSFSLASRALLAAESRHRRSLAPLRSDLLPAALSRYPCVPSLDFTLCPRVADAHLALAARSLRAALRSVDLSGSRSFGRAGLDCLVAHCPSLAEINLSNNAHLTDVEVSALGRASNLERLWLSRCKMVTDVGIGHVAVGCSKLRVLGLKWCLGVTDLGVELLAVKCKQLTSLDLSYLPITHKCLPKLLQLQHLEDLALEGCLGIDDEGLMTVKQECKSLKVLNLSNCQNISQAGFSSLSKGAVNLCQLLLSHCFPITQSLANGLQKLSNLHSIKLDGCQVTPFNLTTIGNSSVSLRELSLSKCSGVTDESLSSIVRKHKQLTKLDITCCRSITDASIESITASCTSLVSLRMESCNLVSKGAFILIGQRCHLLKELDLTDNELDDEGLKSISRCSKLSILKVGICMNLSDEGLVHVGSSCEELQELDLYRSVGITDVGVAAVALGCPGLHSINLAYCTEITDSSLKSLSKCSKLTTVEIRGCSQVTSSSLSAIAATCKQITKVDIKKCHNINDVGLFSLSYYSRSLRQINLAYCSISDMALLALTNNSCLQCLNILHVRDLTPNGLVATLLACRSLIKVKLHSSFKSLLPQHVIEHIQARGCHFQWIDKPFQVEVKCSKIWKQQLADVYNVVY